MTLHQMIAGEHRQVRRLVMFGGMGAVLVAAAATLVVAVFVLGDGQWITLPAILPLLFWGALIAALVAGIALTRTRAQKRFNVGSIASEVERERGLRAGALRGALEVAGDTSLGRANATRIADGLSGNRALLAPALRSRFRRQAMIWTAAAAGALVLLVSVALARPDGALAFVHPLAAYEGSLVPALRLEAPAIVRRGERVAVSVIAVGRRSVDIQHRVTGRPVVTTSLRVENDTARMTLGPLEAATTVVAEDGRTTSDTLAIRVVERPFLGDVRLRATFPAYLNRPAETLPFGEPARVPRGTTIEIEGHASTPLKSVKLRRGADVLTLGTTDRTFRGRFVVADKSTGRWEWDAAGVNETIADLPGALELDVRPDSLPTADILAPLADTLLALAGRVVIRGAASDDHGLSQVVVRTFRMAGGRTPGAPAEMLLTRAAPGWSGDIPLDLEGRGVQPGDELHVVIEATDNSPWRQKGQSRELIIRVPTASERRELARSAGDSVVASASAMVARQKDLERRTGDAAKSRGQRQASNPTEASSQGKSSPVPYEATQQARSIVREQKGLAEKVKQLQENAAALEQQLKAAGALDSGLARQLSETQSLLKDALTPELAEQLQQLEKAMQQMSPEQMRASLSEMQKQQQRLREQLERSVEMLRRAALEGAMQTLRDEAQELAKAERALADSMKSPQPGADKSGKSASQDGEKGGSRESQEGMSEERAREKASELAERARDLSRNVSKLSSRLANEQAVAGTRRARSAAAHAERSSSALERVASPQGGSQSEKDAAADRSAEEAANSMENAAKDLAETRKEQIEEWKEELTEQLDNSIQEMLQLAQEQYALEQEMQQGSEKMGEIRSRQSSVQQGVERTSSKVGSAGKKSSLLGSASQRAMADARREVGEATNTMMESPGDQRGAANEMREAGDAINRAAAALVKDRERAANAASASGFAEMIQRLQQLAQQQGALGAQGQSMLQIPGGEMSGEVRSSLRSMARKQRALAQQLEEMSEGEAGGRASELAREARQIARNLDAGGVDAATVARQQQLFRRLLDAGKTMEQNERDDTGQREAQAAAQAQVFTPQSGTAEGRAAERFLPPQWNDLRGLSADERRAVIEYFRRINAERP